MLESYVTKTRDTSAALKLLHKAMKRYGSPRTIVTDRLRSYGAAMKEIENQDRQEVGRYLNNRAENSHLPLRRRERAMSRFRRMSQLQKLASTHASLLGSLQSRPPHQPETGLQNPARRRPSRMAPASRRLAGLTPHAAGDGFALDGQHPPGGIVLTPSLADQKDQSGSLEIQLDRLEGASKRSLGPSTGPSASVAVELSDPSVFVSVNTGSMASIA